MLMLAKQSDIWDVVVAGFGVCGVKPAHTHFQRSLKAAANFPTFLINAEKEQH